MPGNQIFDFKSMFTWFTRISTQLDIVTIKRIIFKKYGK